MTASNQKPYAGVFIGDTHHFALRVYTEDTDLGGVVYHANYLHFLERARSDMLRCLGINQRATLESGIGIYAVSELQIKYCRPARLEDELVVVSRLGDLRGASCVIYQKILRGQELLADATVKAAFLTPAGRPTRQPAEWVQKFEAIKARASSTGSESS